MGYKVMKLELIRRKKLVSAQYFKFTCTVALVTLITWFPTSGLGCSSICVADEAKLGRYVHFPGIEGAVRVYPTWRNSS